MSRSKRALIALPLALPFDPGPVAASLGVQAAQAAQATSSSARMVDPARRACQLADRGGELVDLLPPRVLVIPCGVGAVTAGACDALHHEAQDEVVLAIGQ